jgi:hypothetical protein
MQGSDSIIGRSMGVHAEGKVYCANIVEVMDVSPF